MQREVVVNWGWQKQTTPLMVSIHFALVHICWELPFAPLLLCCSLTTSWEILGKAEEFNAGNIK